MLPRRALTPALAVLAVLALAACTPASVVATPTPTALSEDEAYAQAEAAFTAYVDALNKIDAADPASFEPAFALTTGTLNASDRKKFSQWHADGWVEGGVLKIVSIMPAAFEESLNTVDLRVCLDASQVTLVDSGGSSQVDPDRMDVAPVKATVLREADPDRWLIQQLALAKEEFAC